LNFAQFETDEFLKLEMDCAEADSNNATSPIANDAKIVSPAKRQRVHAPISVTLDDDDDDDEDDEKEDKANDNNDNNNDNTVVAADQTAVQPAPTSSTSGAVVEQLDTALAGVLHFLNDAAAQEAAAQQQATLTDSSAPTPAAVPFQPIAVAEKPLAKIQQLADLVHAQQESLNARTNETVALRRRLAAYDSIVRKSNATAMQPTGVVGRMAVGSPIGVALAATSLMDDPNSSNVQLKLLQYDLREVSSERDQLLKWNTQLKKQLNELRRQKGAYLYSLVETEADKAAQKASAADAEAATNARAAELLGRARADAAQAKATAKAAQKRADELETRLRESDGRVMQLHDAERAAAAAAAEAQRLVAAANERVAVEEAARKAEAARAVEALRAAERLDGKLEERAARELAANRHADELRAELTHTLALKSAAEQQLVKVERELDALAEKLANSTAEREAMLLEAERRGAQLQLHQNASAEHRQLADKAQAELREQLEALRQRCDELQENVLEIEREKGSLLQQLEEAERAAAAANGAEDEIADDGIPTALAERQRARAAQLRLESELRSCQASLRAEMRQRRLLYNELQELKGNIRVFCRVRPLSENERTDNERAIVQVPRHGGGKVLEMQTTEANTSAPATRAFEYDRVFGPTDGQAEVFEETRPLIASVLDGYNVCVFAYGQTGSGKTHTMEGAATDRGVNYRALSELFDQARQRAHGSINPLELTNTGNGADGDDPLSGSQCAFDVRCSVLEIHNERVVDLLGEPGDQRVLDIRQGGPRGVHVPGLMQERVTSLEQVQEVIKRGQQNRSVGATDMNEHSSRSHLVVQIVVGATYHTPQAAGADANAAGGALMQTLSKLTLVDLAGSERLARSKAEGDRLKETQSINKSLAALGDCIAALAQKQKHVPYRNSKLTFLLQDSLGGDAKTLMFCNVSPSTSSEQETICSLQFAQRVRKVEKGAANKQQTIAQPAAPVADDEGVRKLKAELEKERASSKTLAAAADALKRRIAQLESAPTTAPSNAATAMAPPSTTSRLRAPGGNTTTAAATTTTNTTTTTATTPSKRRRGDAETSAAATATTTTTAAAARATGKRLSMASENVSTNTTTATTTTTRASSGVSSITPLAAANQPAAKRATRRTGLAPPTATASGTTRSRATSPSKRYVSPYSAEALNATNNK
jgi:kinesin family protein C2/C3